MITDKTLLEQMRISDIEIFHRMQLLDLSREDLDQLCSHQKLVEAGIEQIVEEFYAEQTRFDEISLLIGDSETMRRLRIAQRRYMVELFSGYYDHEYVNSRLRIGLVHKRIGVEPKLFLSGIRTIKFILSNYLERNIEDKAVLRHTLQTLDKLLYFDMTLVFDTYIDTLVSEVETAKRRAEAYAHSLEDKTKELSNYAERDPLTQLYNKRGMTNILRNELRLAQRRHTLLSVIYFDVNKFKFINDTYGHARGDEVLVQLAACIIAGVRTADFPCRMGGDEFCIILPDCDEVSARTVARRISEDFSALDPEYSVSFGVSETGRQDYVDDETLIHRADEKMYDHKVEVSGKSPAKAVASDSAA